MNRVDTRLRDVSVIVTPELENLLQELSRSFEIPMGNPTPKPRTAYIVNSLKRPEEVKRLRNIYGNGFYLIAAHNDYEKRLQRLTGLAAMTDAEALNLIGRDFDDKEEQGQRLNKTFSLADFFMRVDADGQDSEINTRREVERILRIMCGDPFVTPTFDEHAMYFAFVSALRSADLSRQVVGTYVRAYAFLSQIFDYGNTDFEKRAIFFRYLQRLLKFGREREGLDLSEVKLTHHNLRNRGKRNLPLDYNDMPKLDPITEAGAGMVREKQKAYLTEIIEQLNTLYGTDVSEGDLLSHASTVEEKILESTVLQNQASSNSKEQFANSPDLTNEILNAIIDSMDVQTELSTRAINSEQIREGLKRVLLNQLTLYEKLRQRAGTA